MRLKHPQILRTARRIFFRAGAAASTHYWHSPEDKLVVVTMEQRWPYSPETEVALKPVIYGAMEH